MMILKECKKCDKYIDRDKYNQNEGLCNKCFKGE